MVDVQVWLATIYYNNWRTEETVTVFHLNVSKRDGEGGGGDREEELLLGDDWGVVITI